MAEKPNVEITGESQITVNKKAAAIVVAVVVVVVGGIAWMFGVTATARMPNANSGGYAVHE